MDKETLAVYISTERARGVRDEELRTELITKGWSENDVTEALGVVAVAVATTLPTVWSLLQSSFDELWRNIWKAFLITLLPIGATLALGFLGGASAILLTHSSTMVPAVTTVTALVICAVIVLAGLSVNAMIMVIKQIENDWKLSYGASFSESLPLVIPMLWVAILTTIASFGGLVLFIIPGIIAELWFSFAQIACVLDGKKGLNALVYSKEIVRGRVWKVLGYYFIAVIIILIVNFLIGLIPIVGMFVSFLTTPFLLIFSVRFYKALKSLYSDTGNTDTSMRVTKTFIIISVFVLVLSALCIAYFLHK